MAKTKAGTGVVLRPTRLKAVVRLAARDRAFCNALVKSPDAALTKAKLRLPPGELKKLKISTRGKRLAVDPRDASILVRRIHTMSDWVVSWPPPASAIKHRR